MDKRIQAFRNYCREPLAHPIPDEVKDGFLLEAFANTPDGITAEAAETAWRELSKMFRDRVQLDLIGDGLVNVSITNNGKLRFRASPESVMAAPPDDRLRETREADE